MSIWGKILGGAAGFAIGGPLGALLGAVAGHAVDQIARCGPEGAEPAEPKDGTKSIVFTIGVVVLAAKLAKVDGLVRRVEVEAFKRTFEVPPDELKNVGRVFDLARRDSQGFEVYARQIAGLFKPGDPVLEELLESLLRIAEADGEVHAAELGYLRDVAGIFGFDEPGVRRILAEHCALCGRPDADPYAVLGVARDADDGAVKTAYRRLVREHHPDRLIAQGLPGEFVDRATEKMAAINAAYSRIQKERQPA
ncbi:TerB family tellurite resistance protein [Azospirillum sp. TSO22-1]|uniref:TerB family tellurite resistance protein n=1 Tax=Azospirillum sp. TSO22-1 TaxID=716789 RepID=UPI000D60BA6F|nr:TerB family tellurite resistance protein [Azospirillum sp. TSO22-1]PWC54299.1 molecular chaperone DnaJ [Azospirillum sp. TSO22-1]